MVCNRSQAAISSAFCNATPSSSFSPIKTDFINSGAFSPLKRCSPPSASSRSMLSRCPPACTSSPRQFSVSTRRTAIPSGWSSEDVAVFPRVVAERDHPLRILHIHLYAPTTVPASSLSHSRSKLIITAIISESERMGSELLEVAGEADSVSVLSAGRVMPGVGKEWESGGVRAGCRFCFRDAGC